MVKREDKMTIGETRALAAEQLLERKRIGLECAIEALETVGYHVRKDERGKFRVTHPFSVFDQLDVDALRPSSIVQDDFLGEYPTILAADQAAEILHVSKRTVTRMCAKKQLPSFKAGNMIRIPKQALIDTMADEVG